MKSLKEILRNRPAYLLAASFLSLYIFIGLALRIYFITSVGGQFTSSQNLQCVTLGLLADLCMGICLCAPIFAFHLTWNQIKYNQYVGGALVLLWLVALVYSFLPNSLFAQYGGVVPTIAKILIGWKLLSFALRYFLHNIRASWQRVTIYALWFVYISLMLIIEASEYFFWDEFGTRFNFIAVDYLVYTNEVIGNIMESYAIGPMVAGVVVLSVLLIWLPYRWLKPLPMKTTHTPLRLVSEVVCYCLLFGASVFGLSWINGITDDNQYVTQIQQNGSYDFIEAFQNHTLDYTKFYTLLPEQECKQIYQQTVCTDSIAQTTDSVAAKKYNIVLITVESLSASFMQRFGNQEGLTPNLDRLAQESLTFDSLYANGNRTVRGLEALSLCIPPHAGESVIKNKNNRMGDLSVGAVLKSLGYQTQFLYAGDSYFDNMEDFFSHNSYEVIDSKKFLPGEVTYGNIWGACDEDLYNKCLKVFDKDYANGKPFFGHVMTTSNHRPYTYPAGRIKVEGNPNTRGAAVRYTDYAIGKFLTDAKAKAWFQNTIFIIVADHCASSAGKTSIPVDRYHIPCIVYCPSLVQPQVVKTLCSQIDVMPTVLSLMNLKAQTRFAGRNVLSADFHPRAFLATYQDLGYLEADTLTVLSPVRRVMQYTVQPEDNSQQEVPEQQQNQSLIRRAQALYQYTNLYLAGESAVK